MGDIELKEWLRGALSAGISAAASAISSGTLVTGFAPNQFNFYTWKFYVLVAAMALQAGVVSIAKFLASHPLPDELKTVTTGVAVTEQEGSAPKTVTTVTESHQEPK